MENNHFRKIWEILKPFIIYYALYSAAFILLLSLCRAIAEGLGNDCQAYLAAHAETATELVNGLSMALAVLPLVPMLRRELAEHKRSVRGAGDEMGETLNRKRTLPTEYLLTVLLAASSSLGLNILFALTGLVQSSAAYQNVARQQYGVIFGAGMLLFGLIAPVTEEIVFRGLLFNRMRRYYPHAAAVLVSGALFGLYHGNLVQGLYGGCMGILLAYVYERFHIFPLPCLFHAAANLVVYTAAQNAALQSHLYTLPVCVGLLMCAGICIWGIEKLSA